MEANDKNTPTFLRLRNISPIIRHRVIYRRKSIAPQSEMPIFANKHTTASHT